MSENVYKPSIATVLETNLEAGGRRPIRTLKIQVDDPEERKMFLHRPGQFLIASAIGTGESVFAINSVPNSDGILEFSVMRVGNVTSKLHEMETGDKMGVRGPFGNYFPVEEWKKKNIVFIGAYS